MSPPEYVVPAENLDDFEAMLAAWRRLDRSDLPCTVRGARPGDRIDLGHGRYARAFRAVHRVPTIGWALVSTKRRLKAELHGLPQAELVARRRAGDVIEDEVETVEVAFCGDTVIDVVEREELVRTARLLILEVTFVDDRVPIELARSKGHIHLDEVVAIADRFANEALLFTHFSARYSSEQIVAALDAKLPPGLRERVRPLLPSPAG